VRKLAFAAAFPPSTVGRCAILGQFVANDRLGGAASGRCADNAPMTMTVRCVNVPRAEGCAGAAPDSSAARVADRVLRLAPAAGPVEIGPRGFAIGPDIPRPVDPSIATEDHALAHALYAYPTAHHPFWRTVRAQARVAAPDDPLPPASFDEHLALDGVQENELWVGDVLRFPDCVLVVGVPRLPDARFNATLGFPQAATMVAQSRWSGFWLAVRVPGRITPGDAFELLPGPRANGLVELFRARLKSQSTSAG